MKIIADGINGNYLRDILDNGISKTEWVKAAVAYASGSPRIIEKCIEHNVPLEFWGRYDETMPISTHILERFLNLGPKYTCKLIWQFYHPKVIWMYPYGIYIGSANFTNNAWGKNIECGVFLNHSEMVSSDLIKEFDEFFEEIDKKSFYLTSEFVSKINNFTKNSNFQQKREIEETTKSELNSVLKSIVPNFFSGLSVVSKKSASEKRKLEFLVEWNETLTKLRQISKLVIQDENRPTWVRSDLPEGTQVDQFLHAYYYTKVRDGVKSLYKEHYESNRKDPQQALENAMKWWKELPGPVESEDIMLYDWAPFLKNALDKNKLKSLSKEEFIELCGKFHAFWGVARQTSNEELGLPKETPKIDRIPRIRLVAEWIWDHRSQNGSNILEVIYWVLYGGAKEDITERLWKASFEEEWHITRIGIGCLGELIGWALPNEFPPRNGRTSKALRSLGFNVRVYSE